MENIETILEGIELTDDQRNKIIKGVTANYKTVAEMNGKVNRISELEAEIKKRDDAISELQGDQSEIEALRGQVAEYQAADEKRKADEAERDRLRTFEQQFNSAVTETGKEFVNSYTRDAVLKDALDRCTNTASLGISDALKAIENDNPSIWLNPQNDVNAMPDPNKVKADKDHEFKNDTKTILDFMSGK